MEALDAFLTFGVFGSVNIEVFISGTQGVAITGFKGVVPLEVGDCKVGLVFDFGEDHFGLEPIIGVAIDLDDSDAFLVANGDEFVIGGDIHSLTAAGDGVAHHGVIVDSYEIRI